MMIAATFAVLSLAFGLFFAPAGPGAVAGRSRARSRRAAGRAVRLRWSTRPSTRGDGAFLPVTVVFTLVGFISTAVSPGSSKGRADDRRTARPGGAMLILLSAIGVVRFGDVFERMHALSKASTLGFLLVMVGGVVGMNDVNDSPSSPSPPPSR